MIEAKNISAVTQGLALKFDKTIISLNGTDLSDLFRQALEKECTCLIVQDAHSFLYHPLLNQWMLIGEISVPKPPHKIITLDEKIIV